MVKEEKLALIRDRLDQLPLIEASDALSYAEFFANAQNDMHDLFAALKESKGLQGCVCPPQSTPATHSAICAWSPIVKRAAYPVRGYRPAAPFAGIGAERSHGLKPTFARTSTYAKRVKARLGSHSVIITRRANDLFQLTYRITRPLSIIGEILVK